jgi:hypothetical protein
LAKTEGTRPIYDFIEALDNVDLVFTRIVRHRLFRGEKVKFDDVLNEFKL